MNKGLFARILVCISFFGWCLYSYIDMQNGITKLRIRIPELTKAVRRIQEENTRFLYEIEEFESPENLMRLATKSEYSFLKFPTSIEVLSLREGEPLYVGEEKILRRKKPSITFAKGATP